MRLLPATIVFMLSCIASSIYASEVSDTIPDHLEFLSLRFEYDPDDCGGEISFSFDERDDCVIDLTDFFVRNNEKKSCDVRIYVELPRGLSMTTSRLRVEGDYQLDTGGSVSMSANYTMEGTERELTLWQRWRNRDAGLVADTFIEEQWWSGDQNSRPFSPCGGVAVFHGNFSIESKSKEGKKLSIIDIGRTDLGIGSIKEKSTARWGWDYKPCNGR